jgi:hypothetical protein
MKRTEDIAPEVMELLAAFCDGTATAAQGERLEILLDAEADGPQLLLDYLQLDADLQMIMQGQQAMTAALAQILAPEIAAPRALAQNASLPRGRLAAQPRVWAVAAAVLAMVTLAIVGSQKLPRSNRNDGGNNVSTVAAAAAPVAVAQLTRVVGCRWSGTAATPRPGDRLSAGQSLQLAAGVAEIHMDIGVKVVLQSPAALTLESDKRLRLAVGKVTAEILSASARGFQIVTPEGTFVDQGTEFGVEATRDGSGAVHVFRGAVDVTPNASRDVPLLPHRLRENCGARLDEDSRSLTLLQDTGESFIRSLDQAERDRHVVAYWRFEDRPLGVILPDTQENTKPVRATIDSSFNSNDLFVYVPKNRPKFSGDVPAAIVPQTGAANRGCLDLTAPTGGDTSNREVYSHSQFSHASPLDVQKIASAQWTIEAAIKAKYLHRGAQTFVCRDGQPGQRARLVFQINAQDRFGITFADGQGRFHEAVASQLPIAENRWYSLAATSDGRALRLYVDDRAGRGYQLAASTALPAAGSTALGNAGNTCDWALGRVRHPPDDIAEWFQGWIDEVRICDVALPPAAFLFAEKARTSK